MSVMAVCAMTVSCRTAPDVGPAPPRQAATLPAPPPLRWQGLIGEYGSESETILLLERDGALVFRAKGEPEVALRERSNDEFVFARDDSPPVLFRRDGSGRATYIEIGERRITRRRVGPDLGDQLVITPVRSIAELRREARAASPPIEAGPFRASNLVELTTLDPTIKLEIRYATRSNLFGTPFYTHARAFLQHPVANALVRVSAALRARGYGLLVHDGYRPWSVTKMFWDAAPVDKRIFVANPAEGSKHNRGAAVDLTLYDLATGKPVEMPSTYDETTDRAAAEYPGGTSRQRWLRDLLRHTMEMEHFTVNPTEWWHFDYADWRHYPIENAAFEDLR